MPRSEPTQRKPQRGAAEGRPPLWRRPKAASFVLALNTGHASLLRRKTCALLRAKTSALLRRKTRAVMRARMCALFRANIIRASTPNIQDVGSLCFAIFLRPQHAGSLCFTVIPHPGDNAGGKARNFEGPGDPMGSQAGKPSRETQDAGSLWDHRVLQ